MSAITFSNGKTANVRAMSPLLLQRIEQALRVEWPKPTPPTYEVETAGGDKEVNEHDATTIKTPEEITAFENYQKELNRWMAELSRRNINAMVLKAVDFELTNVAQWAEEMTFLKLPVSENPLERKVAYFEAEFIHTPADLQHFMVAVMREMGLSKEQLDSVDELFRRAVSKSANTSLDAEGNGVEISESVGGVPV